jgi:hypothetical protein
LGLLGVVNPPYVSQLFLVPPTGANIPDLPLPFGWPILTMICFGVLAPTISLWFGLRKGLALGGVESGVGSCCPDLLHFSVDLAGIDGPGHDSSLQEVLFGWSLMAEWSPGQRAERSML